MALVDAPLETGLKGRVGSDEYTPLETGLKGRVGSDEDTPLETGLRGRAESLVPVAVVVLGWEMITSSSLTDMTVMLG